MKTIPIKIMSPIIIGNITDSGKLSYYIIPLRKFKEIDGIIKFTALAFSCCLVDSKSSGNWFITDFDNRLIPSNTPIPKEYHHMMIDKLFNFASKNKI